MPQSYVVPSLVGEYVRLDPLGAEHIPALVAAANEDRSTYRYTAVPGDLTTMTHQVQWLQAEFDAGLAVPFVQVDLADQRVVGMTRFMTIRASGGRPTPYAVEIGGTWLAASVQRTGINTESKMLLLRHAFDRWRVSRVDLKTDHRNERSRAAITRIGASFEGVLRHWQPSMVEGEEGLFRDTAMFSIVDEEWPRIRTLLASLLQ